MLKQNLTDVAVWIKQITQALGQPQDFKVHVFSKSAHSSMTAVMYLTTITDHDKIMNEIIAPLSDYIASSTSNPNQSTRLSETAQHDDDFPVWLMMRSDAKPVQLQPPSLLNMLIQGHTLVISESCSMALAVNTTKWNDRGISSSDRENSLTGPQDSFNENIETNLSLIRRRYQHPSLRINAYTVGSKSRTKVFLLHNEDKVDPLMLKQITSKLDKGMKTELLLNSTQLAKYITGGQFSPFTLYQSTERPDTAVSAMADGRVVMLVDTTPVASILPTTMISMYQTPDDYYFSSLVSSFMRIVRFMGMLVTMFLPGIYIALTSVNQDILRLKVMLAIAASREGVPYPAFIEVLIMMILLEFINEASVRLPKVIGGTAAIVGGLIIGTAAAQSHLVGTIMIVITAATAVGSFTAPSYVIGFTWRIFGYGLTIMAIVAGVYGMTIGTSFILIYLCHLKSLGVPYLSPLDTNYFKDLIRDTFIRLPLTAFKHAVHSYSSTSVEPSNQHTSTPTKEEDL